MIMFSTIGKLLQHILQISHRLFGISVLPSFPHKTPFLLHKIPFLLHKIPPYTILLHETSSDTIYYPRYHEISMYYPRYPRYNEIPSSQYEIHIHTDMTDIPFFSFGGNLAHHFLTHFYYMMIFIGIYIELY